MSQKNDGVGYVSFIEVTVAIGEPGMHTTWGVVTAEFRLKSLRYLPVKLHSLQRDWYNTSQGAGMNKENFVLCPLPERVVSV